MTFDHLESLAVAMNCHVCGKYAAAGMHRGADGQWRHPHCCPAPACVAKHARVEPLEAGEIAPVVGTQADLFQGGGE